MPHLKKREGVRGRPPRLPRRKQGRPLPGITHAIIAAQCLSGTNEFTLLHELVRASLHCRFFAKWCVESTTLIFLQTIPIHALSCGHIKHQPPISPLSRVSAGAAATKNTTPATENTAWTHKTPGSNIRHHSSNSKHQRGNAEHPASNAKHPRSRQR